MEIGARTKYDFRKEYIVCRVHYIHTSVKLALKNKLRNILFITG